MVCDDVEEQYSSDHNLREIPAPSQAPGLPLNSGKTMCQTAIKSLRNRQSLGREMLMNIMGKGKTRKNERSWRTADGYSWASKGSRDNKMAQTNLFFAIHVNPNEKYFAEAKGISFKFQEKKVLFLVACTRLYNSLCWLVGPSVRLSVGT